MTPVEEIVQTMGDLVRSGKIRYYALSDMTAWLAVKAATCGRARLRHGGHAMESAGRGFLSGKYRRDDTSFTGRLSGPNPFGNSKFTERNWDVLEVLRSVVGGIDRPMEQVALAWVMARPGVTVTLIGASTLSELISNINASEITLSEDEMMCLDEASTPASKPSMAPVWAAIRRMVFGGNDVAGWSK